MRSKDKKKKKGKKKKKKRKKKKRKKKKRKKILSHTWATRGLFMGAEMEVRLKAKQAKN